MLYTVDSRLGNHRHETRPPKKEKKKKKRKEKEE